MKLHLALPQTKTKNDLGAWIADNSIEPRDHEEKVDYTADEIAEWKSKSALISIEIDKLEGVKETFMHFLKKGTFFDQAKEQFEDQRVLIPGTKGIDKLKENREHAGLQITNGFHTITTKLYGVPYSTTKKIHFFDVEGNHWEQYDYKMNPHQLEKYGNPLFDESARNKLKDTKITMGVVGGEEHEMTGEQFLKATDKMSKSHSERKKGDDPEGDDLPFDI